MNTLKKIVQFFFLVLISNISFSQIGIKQSNSAPHPSAMLDVESTNKGLLIPRMTSLQRTQINSPAIGLHVYDTDTKSDWYWDGTIWKNQLTVASNSPWQLSENNIYNGNNGYVGIGIANPSTPLHIHNNLANFKLTNPTFPDNGLKFSLTDSYAGIGTVEQIPLRLFTNNLERLSVNENGKIGIGINSPQSNLHIHNPNFGIPSKNLLQFTNFSTGSGDSDGLFIGQNSSLDASIINNENSHLFLGTGGRGDLVISDRGSVCIGNIIPDQNIKLLVNGGFSHTYLKLANYSSGWTFTDGFTIGLTDDRMAHLINQELNGLRLQGGAGALFDLNANGNFRVGSSVIAPSEKLEVDGNVKINGTMINEAVQNPTLAANWSNYGSTFEVAGYYKDKENLVHLSGLVQNNINGPGSVIFTLPPNYRPAGDKIFVTMNNNNFGRIDISTNGNVMLSASNGVNGWLSLEGITFRVN